MKKLLVLFTLALSFNAFATEYVIDGGHSNVGFTVRHLVSKVNGEFKDFTGEFKFDAKKVADASGKFVVKSGSVNTNIEKRDNHLKSADFFDADKHPELTFQVKKLSPAGKGKYKMMGDLTLRGVTKPVTFDVEFLGATKGFQGEERIGFTASTKINRKDFGISWNKTLDAGGVVLGEEVAININVEAGEKMPEKK